MTPDRFSETDTPRFLHLAASEGWITDAGEIDFLLSSFPQGCLVRRLQGRGEAFVTSLRHERSGWIGNLLVQPSLRRQGTGGELMAEALAALEQGGVETVWLTASPSGKPLYERLGFKEIDTIRRWRGGGLEAALPVGGESRLSDLLRWDSAGWGDRRERLLRSLVAVGTLHAGSGGCLVIRPQGRHSQIGPWVGESASALVELFEETVRPADPGRLFLLDVPEGNGAVTCCLEQNGFVTTGTTVLMYRGKTPGYRPDLIGALGSFGSMG